MAKEKKKEKRKKEKKLDKKKELKIKEKKKALKAKKGKKGEKKRKREKAPARNLPAPRPREHDARENSFGKIELLGRILQYARDNRLLDDDLLCRWGKDVLSNDELARLELRESDDSLPPGRPIGLKENIGGFEL